MGLGIDLLSARFWRRLWLAAQMCELLARKILMLGYSLVGDFFLWKNGFGDGQIKFVTTNKNFKRLFFGVSVFFPKTFQKI
jgi:hypothetical protein